MSEQSHQSPRPIFLVAGRLEPTVGLPSAAKIADLQMPTVIINSLVRAGLITVGDVRNASDSYLKCVRGIGPHAFRYLRVNLG